MCVRAICVSACALSFSNTLSEIVRMYRAIRLQGIDSGRKRKSIV